MVQQICDGLTDQKIYRFAGKWLARLPHPFTAADERADYRWQLWCGRSSSPPPWRWTGVVRAYFFEELIRDDIDIGRPDKVDIVSAPDPPARQEPTPGTFRTEVITTGYGVLYLYYRRTQVNST